MPEEQPDPIFCPVCDREYRQADYNQNAYKFVARHIEAQHPEYPNIEEWIE